MCRGGVFSSWSTAGSACHLSRGLENPFLYVREYLHNSVSIDIELCFAFAATCIRGVTRLSTQLHVVQFKHTNTL